MASSTSSPVALVPAPPGYVVDFDHPQRRGLPAAYWVTGFGMIISSSFLAMRMFTKLKIVRDFKLEDWCIVWSYIFSLSVQACILRSYTSKAGAVHIWEESIAQVNYFSVIVIVAAVLYVPCLALAKFSLLLFYHRMSQLKWLKLLSIAVMVVVMGYSISTILTLIFPCSPIKKAWDVTIVEGHCINRGAVYLVQAITNIVTDVILLLLPIPMVWKLQMPVPQKIGLVILFIIGSLTCVTSVVRLVLLLPTLTTTDQPWAIAIPSIWINIEANLVIICASLPSLRLFLRHFAPKFIGEYSLGRSRTGGYAANGYGSNPSRVTSKIQSKMHSRSSYGRMNYSDTGTDVELQSNYPKVWSECHRGSQEIKPGDISHLDDPTPPGSGHAHREDMRNHGIVVTKTFG